MLPHIFPHVILTTPTLFPWDKKRSSRKKLVLKNVLIPTTTACYLTIAGYGFFFGRLRVPTRRGLGYLSQIGGKVNSTEFFKDRLLASGPQGLGDTDSGVGLINPARACHFDTCV